MSVKQTVKFIEQLLLGSRLKNTWRTNEMFVSTDEFACRHAGNLTPGTFSLTPSSNPRLAFHAFREKAATI